MIKTVFFDLDDTILDFKLSERNALIKTFKELGINPEDNLLDRYSVINLQQWKRLEVKEITREQVKVGRYKIVFDEFGIDASPELATKLYESNLACGHYFLDGAPQMLEKIHKDFDLYLVSNGSKRVQEGRLSTANINQYFKGIFISEVVGCEKPAKEFFDYCFSKIDNFDRSCAVIVGDSLTSDIKGGVNSGIKTIWYNPNKLENSSDIKPDYEANSFEEIIQTLYNI
ncbi:MAG: YjjG family noncanonical pyrimidine nucleotidase [Eubacterium sp.]|nr:YjjG family noncanonical pyrimidine nucleotidase [Eubacterium sp.]